MRLVRITQLLGALLVALTIIDIVFVVGLATSLDGPAGGTAIGLWVAAGLQAVSLLLVICTSTLYLPKLSTSPSISRSQQWTIVSTTVVILIAAVGTTGPFLFLTLFGGEHIHVRLWNRPRSFYTTICPVFWILAALTTIVYLSCLVLATRKRRSSNQHGAKRDEFGMSMPQIREPEQVRPSFCSRETMIGSRPWTPQSGQACSSMLSSSTKVGALSFRTKLTRGSARSSLEIADVLSTERVSQENGFDRYDTSNLNQEIKETILCSSPNMARTGLEPIPGSRPESAASANYDDEPRLPSSPIAVSPSSPRTNPQLSSPYRVATTIPSSPPTSPPNFSRPSSKSQAKPFPTFAAQRQTNNASNLLNASIAEVNTRSRSITPDMTPSMTSTINSDWLTEVGCSRSPKPEDSASMTSLIHPLFRPDSPNPPPSIKTSATMVTASPLANQPMTPRTLSRLRSASATASTPELRRKTSGVGNWKVMPTIPTSPTTPTRPRSRSYGSTVGMPPVANISALIDANSPPLPNEHQLARLNHKQSSDLKRTNTVTSSNIGSPGPSIADEDELPPILPGFVLSAGNRTSLVDYGKRKSVRRDRTSRGSVIRD